MLELRIALDGIDYDTLIPALAPLLIKNPLAAKTTVAAYKLKTKNMSKSEKDALAVNLLNDNKNQILTGLNKKLSEKGITGYVLGFDADVI